jgi:hypothetical protein
MIDAGTLMLTSSTSKGVILQKFYFNDEICIMASLVILPQESHFNTYPGMKILAGFEIFT